MGSRHVTRTSSERAVRAILRIAPFNLALALLLLLAGILGGTAEYVIWVLAAFGYWRLPLLLGVIALASGLRAATGHAFADLAGARALALAGGVALFLLAEALFRRSLGIGPGRWRVAVAVLALATIPLGVAVAAVAQLAVLVVLLVAGFGAEYAAEKRHKRHASPESAGL